MTKGPGKWRPADATRRINAWAREPGLTLTKTRHAKERLLERNLIEADLLHLLKTGFVHDEAEATPYEGCYRYKVEGMTPNSAGRTLASIVIPGPDRGLKVVTIMWKDEA